MTVYMILTVHELLLDAIISRKIRWARRVAGMGEMLIEDKNLVIKKGT